jgi:PAS domain S-box-containing protein
MTKKTKIYLLCSILIMSVFFFVKTSVLLEITESSRFTRGLEYICFILLIPISILMIKDVIKSNENSISKESVDKLIKLENELTNRMTAINKSNAVIEFDLEGNIIFANDLFIKTMGYPSQDEIVGKHHRIFVEDDYEKSEDYCLFWEKLRSGVLFSGEIVRVKKDGSLVYLQASYNPVFDSKGNITDVVKIATDVTDAVTNKKKVDELTKNLTIELKNSEKLKDAIEIEKNNALNDLDVIIKKGQSELIKVIVKCALAVIMGVGIVTTILYWAAIVTNEDTQIIGSTWSNMFSVLLTNAFSIVGTIMGIKYATQDSDKTNK